MKASSIGRVAAVGFAAVLLLGDAAKAEIQTLHMKYVGQPTILFHNQLTEKPFFEQELPKLSGGKITADFIPYDRVGIKGSEQLRLMKAGAFDWGSNSLTYLVADSPKFEGCDLAGLTNEIDLARKACNVYKPVIDKIVEENFNIKIFGFEPYPPQAIWCRDVINGIGDIKGRKVRVYNTTLTDFVEGAGGTAVTIPFVDVVPALQRGVADCAVTGTLSGNSAKWPEVTKSIYPMSLGWAPQYIAVNIKAWKRLNGDTRKFLTGAFAKLEEKAWAVGRQATEEGVSCNTGGKCTLGTKANLVLVKVTDADMKIRAKILKEHVIPNWAKRCGSDCAKEWNATVGKVVGFTAPTNF